MKIVIAQWDNESDLDKMVKDSEVLSQAIDKYYTDELMPLGLKLLKKDMNTIMTDACSYGAFFEKDLEKQ